MGGVAADPADEGALTFIVKAAVGEDDFAHGGCGGGDVGVGDGDGGAGEGQHRRTAHREEGWVFVAFAAGEEEDDGETRTSGAACATGAVQEGFRVRGRVELDCEID